MTKDQIEIGATYSAKVSDKVVPVRIDRVHPRAGWLATNLATNRQVHIKSAQRLRERGSAKMSRESAQAAAAADQENARLRDEREASPDGMTASERAMATSEPKSKQAKGKRKQMLTLSKGYELRRQQMLTLPKGYELRRPASLIDAAAHVLAAATEPMGCKDIVAKVVERGLWHSPKGKTPEATLYSAIIREIKVKGDDARFTKAGPGKFASRTA